MLTSFRKTDRLYPAFTMNITEQIRLYATQKAFTAPDSTFLVGGSKSPSRAILLHLEDGNNYLKGCVKVDSIKTGLRNWAAHLSPTLVLFVIAFMIFEIANGIYDKHFDLGALITFAGVVLAKDAAVMGINSALNSPRGEAPVPPYHPPVNKG